MKENCYVTLKDACEFAKTLLGKNQLLSDGADDWNIDNLIDATINDDTELDGEDNYYCVGLDGSIGIKNDNGVNVNWIYQAK